MNDQRGVSRDPTPGDERRETGRLSIGAVGFFIVMATGLTLFALGWAAYHWIAGGAYP